MPSSACSVAVQHTAMTVTMRALQSAQPRQLPLIQTGRLKSVHFRLPLQFSPTLTTAHLTMLPAPQQSSRIRTQPVAVRSFSITPTMDGRTCFTTTTATGCEGQRLRLSGASFLCHFPSPPRRLFLHRCISGWGRI